MIHCKKFMKIIAVLVIITFIFQGDVFLYSQGEDGLDDLFNKARNEYINGQYVTSKKRLEGIIGEIKENVLGRKDILGKCYLLLGAIYEKEEKTNLARENYRKAIGDYKVQSIDGIDFIGLITLDQVIKEPIERIDRVEGEIDKKFIRARDEYVDGKHINSITRLERIIGTINEKSLDRDDILGKCYLLLGAIYEKENKELLAEENYQKAKGKYNIQSIDGVDLENLTIYKEVIKGVKGKIEKEGKKKKIKKKFPWLLVAGGVVVVVAAAILILKKKKKKYTLTVTRGEGVDGTPISGSTTYTAGEEISYKYSLKPGYSSLVVKVDKKEKAASGTIIMNDNHTLTAEATANTVEFVTDKEKVNIDEGGTETFNVRLSNQPTGDVNVTVSRVEGDKDIRVTTGSNLTFDQDDWNTPKTVTLEAAEDDDTVNGESTIQISGFEIEPKNITAAEVDNDSSNFVTNTNKVSVPEGGAAIFRVKLSLQPSSNVTASISRVTGDSDISVSSGSTSLTFTPSNWNTYQKVTLAAAKDDDTVNGEATIRISAPGTGIPDKDITATEVDNSSLSFVTDKDEVSIDEGSTNTFQVRLSAEPSSEVAASISNVSGDSDISVSSGSSLTFTPSNWNTYQTVTLEAAEDDDTVNGEATIRINAPGTGIPDKDITAREVDNDSLNFVTDKNEVSIDEGGTAAFQVKLSVQPSSNVTASISRVSGDSDISVTDGSSLTFTTSNWNEYQPVTLEAAEDDDVENGETTIRISATGLPDKDITAAENDNDSLEFVTSSQYKVWIEEGRTDFFRVKLSAKPSSNVEAKVEKVSGDEDIRVISGANLTFTPSDWDKWRRVTLEAAEDDDVEYGEAIIRISADEVPNKTLIVIEIDNEDPGNLSVTPDEEFSSFGSAGGPFSPSSKDYTLKNTGGTRIEYTITIFNSATWLTVSSTEGTLVPGEARTVTVKIDESAKYLSQGTYTDTVTFTNTTNHNGDTTQTVTLSVNGG